MSSYQQKHRNYYLKNREEILAGEKQKKRWLTYYENNKETILLKRKQRYQNLQNPFPMYIQTILQDGVQQNVATDSIPIMAQV